MWRRVYLVLVAVRLYFALQPSYIHPDEHFQGPEVIASMLSLGVHNNDDLIRTRRGLWLVIPSHLGIYLHEPHPKHLSAVSVLWLSPNRTEMDLGGPGLWQGLAQGRLLRSSPLDVRAQLCPGRLGIA